MINRILWKNFYPHLKEINDKAKYNIIDRALHMNMSEKTNTSINVDLVLSLTLF